ncbi:MAG: hypothetical protein AAFY28_18970 [Actinomycetota bacterium]
MLGLSEIVIILLALAILVAIVLIATRGAGRGVTTSESDTFAVSGSGRAALDAIATDIHRLNAHRIEWLSPDVMQVSWRHRSGWQLVIAVVVFPVGLLALLFTTSSYGTIVLVDKGSTSTIRLGGRLSNAALAAISARVASATPAAA